MSIHVTLADQHQVRIFKSCLQALGRLGTHLHYCTTYHALTRKHSLNIPNAGTSQELMLEGLPDAVCVEHTHCLNVHLNLHSHSHTTMHNSSSCVPSTAHGRGTWPSRLLKPFSTTTRCMSCQWSKQASSPRWVMVWVVMVELGGVHAHQLPPPTHSTFWQCFAHNALCSSTCTSILSTQAHLSPSNVKMVR